MLRMFLECNEKIFKLIIMMNLKLYKKIWEDTARDVRVLTTGAEIITPYNLKTAVPKLERLRRYAVKDYESARTLVDSISRLLETDVIFDDPAMSSTKDILFGLLEEYARDASIAPGEKVAVNSNTIAIETVVFPTEQIESEDVVIGDSYTFQSMTLSAEALNLARTATEKPRLQLFAYSNELFFHWGKDREWMENLTQIPSEDGVDFGNNWRVLSMSFDGVKIQNLTEPIVYTVPVSDPGNNSQWVCAFWETEGKSHD